jgi:hypothetical protein
MLHPASGIEHLEAFDEDITAILQVYAFRAAPVFEAKCRTLAVNCASPPYGNVLKTSSCNETPIAEAPAL